MVSRITDRGADPTLYYLKKNVLELKQARDQASTGRKGGTYAALEIEAGPEIREEAILKSVDSYIARNVYVDNRMNRVESSLNILLKTAIKFKTMLMEIRSGVTDMTTAATLFQGRLTDVQTILNARDGDSRYIFAGTRTDTAPVDLSLMTPVPLTGGLADTSYYTGDNIILSVRTKEDGPPLSYGILASNPAFEELIRSLRLASTMSYAPPINASRVLDSLTTLDQSIKDITDLIAKAGMDRRQIVLDNREHVDYKEFLNTVLEGRLNVDLPGTIQKVSELKDKVNTSYYLIKTMDSLSLVHHLR